MEIPCICPPKADGQPRHEMDSVTFKERLDFRSALAIRNAVGLLYREAPAVEFSEVLAVLSESYVLFGIEEWTLQRDGEKGPEPIPVSPPAVREFLLPHTELAMEVSDEADSRFSEAVMTPLLAKASSSSPPTPTDESTSPTTESSTPPPKRSKPSSITTIPTAATETTSSALDGASSSSQSSTSAA